MKHTLIILIIFLFTLAAANVVSHDKNKKIICGKVIDKVTGEALPGVKVEIKESGNYCYSDMNGNFVLSVSVDAKQEVEANVVGYEQMRLKTNDLGFNKDISLSPLQ